MVIRTKTESGSYMERVVRSGTIGVEDKRQVFFADTTCSASIGFPKDFCLANKELFQVSRTVEDREISVKDVMVAIESAKLDKMKEELLMNIINGMR